eukprot:363325-Chlamydomonas_euryale.AAC.6
MAACLAHAREHTFRLLPTPPTGPSYNRHARATTELPSHRRCEAADLQLDAATGSRAHQTAPTGRSVQSRHSHRPLL